MIPLSYLIDMSRQRNIFPVYHAVSDNEIIHIKHLYKVRTVREFERDLDFFLKHFQVLAIGDIINGNVWEQRSKPGFLLTFDDGLSQFNDEIAPLLLRKGIPAICFLNTGFIDNAGLFFRYKASIIIDFLRSNSISEATERRIRNIAVRNGVRFRSTLLFPATISYNNRHILDDIASLLSISFEAYLQKNKPYLTLQQIRSLISKGFVFGAHSMDHPLFSDLSLQQQIWQTKMSIDQIDEIFRPPVRLFAFPFTDSGITAAYFDKVFEPLNPIADFTFGCAGLKIDTYQRNIQRIPLEVGTFDAGDIIYGEYLYYLVKRMFNKNIMRR
jgi:peptidoglycan/xylan/chitin deacetylase (PgdA/CDA1 family)